jgi:hypothetical protein
MSRPFLAALAAVAAVAAGAFIVASRREPPPPAAAPVVVERPAATPKAAPAAKTPRTPAPATPAPRRTTAPAPRAAAPAAARSDAPPATGTLTITSDVPGAQVFLDRRFIGATPVTAADVAPGSHQLQVSAPGFDPHVDTIEVAPGAREVAVAFRVVRLDAAIDVVHKHRFGSCRGRLVATAQGVRYETTHTDDAFSAGLLAIETFEVDYLNRNLRIQPQRGKRYDFTDPEGNADRLFLFHRDVEKARERLAALQ